MEPVDFFILLIVFCIMFIWGLIKCPIGTALLIFAIWGIYKLKTKKNGTGS